ncbi:cbb3-type cytochrome c oxidase N-terminal domain-containing protein [Cytophaga aurantiaca]|uniref:cbb3-type cytochrome c oxidase N-terminal domain-containing protein n=1 Tax=Cytophaga aurantiaca TaxID=29530 RepID=UPI001FDF626E|nr:cbb3-type cytochrome c oxidase N-terminal domain-containing protein [Cytophaga aurantiaca]
MILITADPAAITEAAAAATKYVYLPSDPMSAFVIGTLVFIIVVFLFLIFSMLQFKRILYPDKEPALKGFMQKLTDTVPIEKEEEILMDHVYDGIRELDNNLPPWWKYLFYATIVFGFGYIYYYHFTGTDRLQIGEYNQELLVAETEMVEYRKHAANSIDESNVKMSDEAGIKEGYTLFQENCIACHGKTGGGGVGPNLTDEYWLHGGGLSDVFKTIKYGVPQKGMISWKSQLSPLNMQQLTSYIMSLKGTNPEKAKAPQGELYIAK